MIKRFIKYSVYLLLIIIISLLYLTYFGVETKKFNQLIIDEIIKDNTDLDLEIKKVKLVLKPKTLSVGLETKDSNIKFQSKNIKIEKIETNFLLKSFFEKKFAIRKLVIISKKNNLKDLVDLIRVYSNKPEFFFINSILKKGFLTARIDIDFNENGVIYDNYKIEGRVENLKLRSKIDRADFNFKIFNKEYNIDNIQVNLEGTTINSKKILIKEQKNYFLISTEINEVKDEDNVKLLKNFIKKLDTKNFNNISLTTNHKISFKVSKKLKLTDISLKSKIDLKNLDYNSKAKIINTFFRDYKGKINLRNHKIDLVYNKKKYIIKGNGKLSIDSKEDDIDYNISFKNDLLKFKTKIILEKNPILIDFLKYEKIKNQKSIFEIEGMYKKSDDIIFNSVSLKESKNIFKIKDLKINKDYKFKSINKLSLNYKNIDNKKNNITIKKNKKEYLVFGDHLDAKYIVKNLLDPDNKNNSNKIENYLENFNSTIKIDIRNTSIDKETQVTDLNGNINFIKNKLHDVNLQSNFQDDKKIIFTIKHNSKNEKITTLISGKAKPLVKNYKFIKGFEDGFLDFYSLKKGNKSKSQLKIFDFKLKELPALTQLLTLASLQGIADTLTGEGIRFNEFEMNFTNEDNLMNIEEIYAIGPAISILMSGYIETNKLISLRGTLVPARTINKVIGSIPFLGKILVGNKTGEGVFGVSFKIKGPPKKLKTSVNPIKTLTPRFITRTLEKIRNN